MTFSLSPVILFFVFFSSFVVGQQTVEKNVPMKPFSSIAIPPASSQTFSGIAVRVESGRLLGDQISLVSAPAQYTSTLSKDGSVLIISTATPATSTDLLTVLQSNVQFVTQSSCSQGYVTNTLVLSFTLLNDAQDVQDAASTFFSNVTQHWYRPVNESVTWDNAVNRCSNLTYHGRQGYLATITSMAEQNEITAIVNDATMWIGGSDRRTPDDWRWVTGPEGAANSGNGTQFGDFTYWDRNEPNRYGGQDSLRLVNGNRWDDINGETLAEGYLCEFGGFSNDTVENYVSYGSVELSRAGDNSFPDFSLPVNRNPPNVTVAKLGASKFLRVSAPADHDGVVGAENEGVDIISGFVVQLDVRDPSDVLSVPYLLEGMFSTYINETGTLNVYGPEAPVKTYLPSLNSVMLVISNASSSGLIRNVTWTYSYPQSQYARTVYSCITGHFYEYVWESTTWAEAKKSCAQRSRMGSLTGYLATITSKDEAYILTLLTDRFGPGMLTQDAWLGGSDEEAEGVWKWTTGPEAGQNMTFTRWNKGEPNNYNKQDCLKMYPGGMWDDAYCNVAAPAYVCEFGGLSSDPQPPYSTSGTLNLVPGDITSSPTQGPTMSPAPTTTPILLLRNYFVSPFNVVVPDGVTDKVSGFVVRFEKGFLEGDVLRIEGTVDPSMTVSTGLNGVLTVMGPSAAVSQYVALLNVVQITTTSNCTSEGIASGLIVLSWMLIPDGSSNTTQVMFSPATGHYYQLQTSPVTWNAAKTACESVSIYGAQGYLATITSEDEQNFLTSVASINVWLGAKSTGVRAPFRWVTGPEGVANMGTGTPMSYTNWNNYEPNFIQGSDVVRAYAGGKWDDYPSTLTEGYLCEFGGMIGDIVPSYSVTGSQALIRGDPPGTPQPTASFSFRDMENVYFTVGTAATILNVAAPADHDTQEFYRDIAGDVVSGFDVEIVYGGEEGDLLQLQKRDSDLAYVIYSDFKLSVRGNTPRLVKNFTDLLNNVAFIAQNKPARTMPKMLRWNYVYPTSKNIVYSCATGHYYEYVDEKTTWSAARKACETRTRDGANTGYLATVTSEAEQNVIRLLMSKAHITGDAWLGASDTAVEGTWMWVTGPEGLANQGNGTNATYTFWNEGEPNNYGFGEGQDCLLVYGTGRWDDGYCSGNGNVRGYVCEFGGMPTDPETPYTNSGSLQLRENNTTPFTRPPTTIPIDPNVANREIIKGQPITPFNVVLPADRAAMKASGFVVHVNYGLLVGDSLSISNLPSTMTSTFAKKYFMVSGPSLSADEYIGWLNKIVFLTNTSCGHGYLSKSVNISWWLIGENEQPNKYYDYTFSDVTGHFYQYVNQSVNYTDAIYACGNLTFGGLHGYLATITSAEEQIVVQSVTKDYAYLGGRDILAGSKMDWRWVTGPEGLADSGNGTRFNFTSWDARYDGLFPILGMFGEEFAVATDMSGSWIVAVLTKIPRPYLCEYGGMSSDTAVNYPWQGSLQLTRVVTEPPRQMRRWEDLEVTNLNVSLTEPTPLIFESPPSSPYLGLPWDDDSWMDDTIDMDGYDALVGIMVRITNPQDTDALTVAVPTTSDYSSVKVSGQNTAVLNVTGPERRVAYYTKILNTLKFQTSNTSDATRRIFWAYIYTQRERAVYSCATGHYYEYVNRIATWETARLACSQRTHNGYGTGYLATITSQEEESVLDVLTARVRQVIWVGASDRRSEATWRWVTGPEGYESNGLGLNFMYTHWAPGEPNNSGDEDSMTIYPGGDWNDAPNATNNRFLCEYGGMPNDPNPPYINMGVIHATPGEIPPKPTDPTRAPRAPTVQPSVLPVPGDNSQQFNVFRVVAPETVDTFIGFTIRMEKGYATGDTLGINNLDGKYTATFIGGTLSLTGPAQTAASYVQLINSVYFQTTSKCTGEGAVLGHVVITYTLTPSGSSNSTKTFFSSATDHYYVHFKSELSWTQARDACTKTSFQGLQGYLATATDKLEVDFIESVTGSSDYWLGGQYDDVTWRWVTGPEGAADKGRGNTLIFTNWDFEEPTESYYGENTNCMASYRNGLWFSMYPSFAISYVCEYGGMAQDTPKPYNISGYSIFVRPMTAAPTVPPMPTNTTTNGALWDEATYPHLGDLALDVATEIRVVDVEAPPVYGDVFRDRQDYVLGFVMRIEPALVGDELRLNADSIRSSTAKLNITYLTSINELTVVFADNYSRGINAIIDELNEVKFYTNNMSPANRTIIWSYIYESENYIYSCITQRHYEFVYAWVSWQNAVDSCGSRTYRGSGKGYLAEVRSADEQQVLNAVAEYYGVTGYYWLGAQKGSSNENNEWHWVTSEDSFSQGFGSPFNFTYFGEADEDQEPITGTQCLTAYSSGDWVPKECSTSYGVSGYLCEYDLSDPTFTPYITRGHVVLTTSSTASIKPTSSPSPSTTNSPNNNNNNNNTSGAAPEEASKSASTVVGVAVGVPVGILGLLAAVGGFLVYCRRGGNSSVSVGGAGNNVKWDMDNMKKLEGDLLSREDSEMGHPYQKV
eukprot:PhF_6_TR15958/c0_g1_i1/m.24870